MNTVPRQEAAQRLRLSVRQIDRLRNAEVLKEERVVVRGRKRIFVTLASIEAYQTPRLDSAA